MQIDSSIELVKSNECQDDTNTQTDEKPPQCKRLQAKNIHFQHKHPIYSEISKIHLTSQVSLQSPEIKKQINKKMRNRLGKWLVEISLQTFGFSKTTVVHALQILDAYLSKTNHHFSQLQMIGCASLYISSKINESRIVAGECYVESSNGIFTIKQLEERELLILKTLNYQTNYQNPIRMLRFYNLTYQYSQQLMIEMEKYIVDCYFDDSISTISELVLSSSTISSVISNKFVPEIAIRKIIQKFIL